MNEKQIRSRTWTDWRKSKIKTEGGGMPRKREEGWQTEVWKDVVGYEGLYKISDLGNVFSERRKALMRKTNHSKGYDVVGLRKNGVTNTKYVHGLVAEAFLLRPIGRTIVVDHINRNRKDNRLANIRFCEQSLNVVNQNTNRKVGRQGVWFDKRSRRWKVQITKNYKVYCGNSFATHEEACQKREEMEKQLFPDFNYIHHERRKE